MRLTESSLKRLLALCCSLLYRGKLILKSLKCAVSRVPLLKDQVPCLLKLSDLGVLGSEELLRLLSLLLSQRLDQVCLLLREPSNFRLETRLHLLKMTSCQGELLSVRRFQLRDCLQVLLLLRGEFGACLLSSLLRIDLLGFYLT